MRPAIAVIATFLLLSSCVRPGLPGPGVPLPTPNKGPLAAYSESALPSRVSTSFSDGTATVQGLTFAVEEDRVFVPVLEAERLLGSLHAPLEERLSPRTLPDGTELICVRDIVSLWSDVHLEKDKQSISLRRYWRSFTIHIGPKYAEVNLKEQRLRAWQGGRLVLDSRVSSGRRGSTPAGNFRAGPYKARRHFSSLYENAPMPWSVQVTGHVFIHGFTSVPNYPASHGCIRLPLDEGNPAKFFFEWINVGTPIQIVR